jgi:AraC family ethanolamine operon transcriptional activator
VTAVDPDDLARNLTGWNQVYDQITCGIFEGRLDELQLPHMQVFRERISQSVHQSCCVRPDAIWFGLSRETAATRINGRRIEADAVMVRPGAIRFELVTPSDHEIHGIVVSRALLDKRARAGDRALAPALARLESAETLRVDPARRSACLRTLAGLLAGGDDADPAADAAQHQDDALEALVDMLDTSAVEPAAAGSLQRRQRIVAKARDYLLAHRDQLVTIPELCACTHVSRRTLQYCFDDVLGISPVVYLRRLRLNGIRRTLLDEAPGARHIGSIAAEWGIDNFSQFSSDYKKLFGKTPSAYVRECGRRR